MLEGFIPKAFAQGANLAANAKAAANPGAQEGLGNLIQYVLTHLDNWIGGIVILLVFYILGKTASLKARERIIANKGEEVPENVLVLVERMTKIAVLVIGIVIAGAINGVNFGTLIGAISLGIGFAIKDIIGNFISSVVMLAQNRMRIGDFIQVGDIMGTIVSIDTRVTILQALDGTQIVIPNQTMLNSTVTSYSINPFRRIQVDASVGYDADLPTVTSLIKAVLDKHPDVVAKPPSTVLVNAYEDYYIDLTVFFWIESHKNWQQIRSNINYRIFKALVDAGFDIPYPIHTLKIDEDDRAFLKTMESLRKGFVPEEKRNLPDKKTLLEVAESTANAPTLPEKLMEEKPLKPIAPEVPPAPSIQAFKDQQNEPPATPLPAIELAAKR